MDYARFIRIYGMMVEGFVACMDVLSVKRVGAELRERAQRKY